MMFFKLFLIHAAVAVVSVLSAPKSKVTTTYDQKQSGEYNIQLHLKDFQIIALVGDDPLASLGGDYDYNYDYADFTIKPILPTTKQPQNATINITSTTTEKPLIHITTEAPMNATASASTDKSPIIIEIISSTTSKPTTSETTIASSSTTQDKEATTEKPPASIYPGQIPVIVQDFVLPSVTLVKDQRADQRVEAFTSVAIVTDDSATESGDLPDNPALGEILHYRRCPQGYGRDKRGRCRKIRRPQLP